MKKPDARLLNSTTQDYLRQQAIRLREQGKRLVDISNGVQNTGKGEPEKLTKKCKCKQ